MMTKIVAATASFSIASLMGACGAQQGNVAEEPSESPVTHVATTYPEYPSLTELARESDVVVVGEIAGIQGRGVDKGDERNVGIPMIWYDFKVTETIAGTEVPDVITVAWMDAVAVGDQELSRLDDSGRLVLYLESVDRSGRSGPQMAFVPLGGDNGVLDVTAEESVVSRSHVLQSVESTEDSREATPESGAAFTVDLDTLRANARVNVP